MSLFVFFKDARLVFKLDALSREILGIALPSALAVAADPLASLIDTAFIGHLGVRILYGPFYDATNYGR
ncbi:MATE efflux family protein [Medicago truncatula]|uniref:MATE efflux family protein n=1 Tax=Medicago truncatula TaxID=3880 RepID=A0A072TQE6_MEDTR|nr:MATE efflux family protein [Medicago truncatula]